MEKVNLEINNIAQILCEFESSSWIFWLFILSQIHLDLSQGWAHTSRLNVSSREWIAKCGLKVKKLGFYDILAGVAFKHQDGVVDIKTAPGTEYMQTDAVSVLFLLTDI